MSAKKPHSLYHFWNLWSWFTIDASTPNSQVLPHIQHGTLYITKSVTLSNNQESEVCAGDVSSKIEIRIEVKAKACTNWMNRQSGFFFWLQLIHFHKYPNKKLLPNSSLKWKEYCSKEGHCNECKRKHIFRISHYKY